MRRGFLLFVLAAALLAGCTQLFFQPYRQHVRTPADIGLAYEDVRLKTADGVALHAWWLPAKGAARGTILFLHGNAENVSTHIGSVYWLPERGFNVLLLDYRGYGASEGTPSMAGAQADIEAAMRYLLDRPGIDRSRIVIFGQSLGGALASYYVAHSPHRAHIRALVVESAPASYRDIAREKAAGFWLTWPLQWPIAWSVSDDYSPVYTMARISPIPLLVIHGERDAIVPLHDGQRLYEAAQEPKELWIVPGGGHIGAFLRPEYRERFVAYLGRVPGAEAREPLRP